MHQHQVRRACHMRCKSARHAVDGFSPSLRPGICADEDDAMKLLCFFGVHRRSLAAIARREGGYVSLCEDCARPLVKQTNGKWSASEPL